MLRSCDDRDVSDQKGCGPATDPFTRGPDTEPEAGLRAAIIEARLAPLVRLASAAIGVHAVQVLLSSLDGQMQWRWRSHEDCTRCSKAALAALGEQVVRSGKSLILDDLRAHDVAGRSPAMGKARIAACAGLPLVLEDGSRIGSLCAVDLQPHSWTGQELEVLRDVAACVTREIELVLRAQKADFERISLAAQAEELRTLSLTDDLTGLSNRRGFFAVAEHEVSVARRSGRALALLFADVDNMKQINDEFGHATGDDVLVDAAAVLKATFRESDVVARVGGDEFAVLACADGEASIPALLERLQRSLDFYNARDGRTYTLSMSMGAAAFDPASPAPVEALLRQADAAMYEVKRSQRSATGGPTLLLRSAG